MTMQKLRELIIATRQSPLALWQASFISNKLKILLPDYNIKLLPMLTTGDKNGPHKWLNQSGKGMFVKELEEALLTKQADLAVHSMKDLPAVFPAGLVLAAICERASPFDAFVSHRYSKLIDLPYGAKIGTASLRRQAQLQHFRSDFNMQTLRGNVQTRLKKMVDENFDAIILAVAGLERLKMHTLICEILTPPLMIPACGQGALGIEARSDNTELLSALAQLHCNDTALCINTERSINATLGGNCHTPVAIYCSITADNKLNIQARVLSQDGVQCIEVSLHGLKSEATLLAIQCAQELIKRGAKKFLN